MTEQLNGEEVKPEMTEEQKREHEQKIIVELKNGFDSLEPVIVKLREDLDTQDDVIRPHAVFMAASFLQNTAHFFKLLHESLEDKTKNETSE